MQAAACSSACARSTLVRSLMIIDRSWVSLRLSLRGSSSFMSPTNEVGFALVEIRLDDAAHQLCHRDLVQLHQQLKLLIVMLIEQRIDVVLHVARIIRSCIRSKSISASIWSSFSNMRSI